MTVPTPIQIIESKRSVGELIQNGYEAIDIGLGLANAFHTEVRADLAEKRLGTLEQRQRFVRFLGETATSRLVNPNFVPDEADVVHAKTRKERRIERKLERRHMDHVAALVEQKRLNAIYGSGNGVIAPFRTRISRRHHAGQLRQAHRRGEISAQQMARGLRETTMHTVRRETLAQRRVTRKIEGTHLIGSRAGLLSTSGADRIRLFRGTGEEIADYVARAERSTDKKVVNARQRLHKLSRKSDERRERYDQRVDDRRARLEARRRAEIEAFDDTVESPVI